MTFRVIDVHPHVISSDTERYPRVPLFGVQSDWSKQRPVTAHGLIAAMDEAGVDRAAVVQSSTCYGYDNACLADAIAEYPGRLTGVGSVDLLQPNAPERIRHWAARGISGLRLFTGGSTAAFDPTTLDDPRAFTSWELCGELGWSMCIQTDPSGLVQVAGLAKRFPRVKIVLDHLGRPDVTDGAPYKRASSLFALAPFENILLKLSARIFAEVKRGAASAESFFPRLVAAFGSARLAWGSNFPATPGKLRDNLETAKECLACLSIEDRAWIFTKTAQRLYPALAVSSQSESVPAPLANL
jgi:predicted TIM-barrel fold metal-dependent hydrolase